MIVKQIKMGFHPLLFAKTLKTASRLSESIRKNEIHKVYLAVIHGKVKEKDTLKDYLKKTDDFNTIISDSKNGKYAELSYELIKYHKELDLSLVKVFLKTGRHHQIRVQFSSRNYTLVGDSRYGIDKEKNIGLFAYKLSFIHPVKKEEMIFTYLPTDKPFNLFDIKNI